MMNLLDPLRRLHDEFRARRLARRGDALRNAPELWDFVATLADDLMPGPAHEIPRDLFQALAFAWAVRAERGVPHDPYAVLRHVRDRAWQGWRDPRVLAAGLREELPHARSAERIGRFLKEIADKGCSHLFLPLVSGVDRHQAQHRPPAHLLLDALGEELAGSTMGRIAREAFALTPSATARERDALMVALLVEAWGKGDRAMDGPALIRAAADGLRRLYLTPEAALAAVRADAIAGHARAAEVVAAAVEVSELDRPLWLEALFHAEGWRAGTQHFEHTVEIRDGTVREVLAASAR
ncbi:hypothetical protein LPC08_25415 (plasmid) [Roseomonas sp. OT10]|uniref:hypothetical protein n=1 Tax=Roseomonas cutis TaxID=2897332 RepID=UPI001E33A13F|nr:hypothetical protein [Roseomonas sp. OT10]UFN51605.1 hypothetical protein LPC08_25415 [Roseomonas sp. OT10]